MKKLLLLFMCVTLLMACSDDDQNNTQTTGLQGRWTMTDYLAFAPEIPELTAGQIVWKFNTDNSTITMSNTVAPYLSGVGTFDYHLEDDNAIIIHSEEGYEFKYFYSFPEGRLRLESELAASDGPIMVFRRFN